MEKSPSSKETVMKAVFKLMKSSNSMEEWEKNEETVKRAFKGNLPDFWFLIFIAGGKKQEIIDNFGSDKKIQMYAEETKDDLFEALKEHRTNCKD